MTLTVVCDVLGRENNGTTIAAMNLIRSMRAKGHTVRVVCPDEAHLGEKDYYVVRTINFGVLNDYVSKNGVCIAHSDEETLHRALEGADALHVMTPFFLSAQAVRIAYDMDLPITAGFHCQAENFTNHIFLMNSAKINKAVYKAFDRYVYSYCDCIHYPSQFICNVFESEIGRKTEHRVISNGVNKAFVRHPAEKPSEYKDKFVILFTGRFSREKRHRVLIDAVAKSKHADSIQLVFAGDGPLLDELKAHGKKLLNPPVFRFFTRQEMVEVLNYADLYVHPAEIEIEAIACLEAISCGLVPVICNSPRSATRYFAQGPRNLFRCNDSDDLADKIDWWLDHPSERKQCSDAYAGYSKQFDFDVCMDAMERMIVDNVKLHRAAEEAAMAADESDDESIEEFARA